MSARASLLCAAALGLWTSTADAADLGPAPRVTCVASGLCSLARLPALSDPEVQGHLKSGLTSTLVLTLQARGADGRQLQAAARIDVRFEPWDELFHVRLLPATGPAPAELLASAAELEAWWRALELRFHLPEAPVGGARVELSVIPFSEDEEADARRWYAEAVRGPDPGRGQGAPPASRLGEVLDTLTLTSIKRRGVLSFSWPVPLGHAP